MASDAGVPQLRQYNRLVAQAEQTCLDCPLIERCLYTAVVQHDVAGYVGGTTPAERVRIRRALRITVTPEDLDTLAGVIGGHRQVDHDEIIRLRHAHPD
ncbi:MAG TPA: WhiB family transcriptional regulator, partial [Mycobacteriales bacterium]|nr:WhiB family transcriptional regulator [Mycobacteriales bacterium]